MSQMCASKAEEILGPCGWKVQEKGDGLLERRANGYESGGGREKVRFKKYGWVLRLPTSELLADLPGLPQVATLMREGQIKGEAQWIGDPGDEWGLNQSPACVNGCTQLNSMNHFPMHFPKVTHRFVDRSTEAGCKSPACLRLHRIRGL